MMIIPVTAQQYIILGWLMMMNNITNNGGIMYNRVTKGLPILTMQTKPSEFRLTSIYCIPTPLLSNQACVIKMY